MNHILCPPCFRLTPGEEKCCSHGCMPGVKCVACGATRAIGEEYWSCLGSVQASQEPGPAPSNASKGDDT